MHRVKDGWPWASKLLVGIVSVTVLSVAIALSVVQVNVQAFNAWFILLGSIILAMTVFSVLSGAAVIFTINVSAVAAPHLLSRRNNSHARTNRALRIRTRSCCLRRPCKCARQCVRVFSHG